MWITKISAFYRYISTIKYNNVIVIKIFIHIFIQIYKYYSLGLLQNKKAFNQDLGRLKLVKKLDYQIRKSIFFIHI